MSITKERPILFSGEMVRAILEGRKTQTRRAVKDQSIIEFNEDGFIWAHNPKHGHPCDYGCSSSPVSVCPYGQPGDRLWVRETHAIVPRTAYRQSVGVEQILKPDCNHDAAIFKASWDRSPPGRWRPSIHMPRWASRITLEITGVRVDRLCDISNDDAISEGIWKYPDEGCYKIYTPTTSFGTINPVKSFRSLWESINGPDSWDANPWAWVVEFKRIDQYPTTEEAGNDE